MMKLISAFGNHFTIILIITDSNIIYLSLGIVDKNALNIL